MSDLTFATPVEPGEAERQVVLLARSIRTYGGRLREGPILALTPGTPDHLAAETRAQLDALDVRVVPFVSDDETLRFPFAVKAYAAAAAEAAADGAADVLAWLDADTLVVREPAGLFLAAAKALACCPIHHVRIGPSFDADLDPFWRLVYTGCGASDTRSFLMHTAVDGDRIRPHINAGLLGVRPGRGLLRTWRDNFARLYTQPAFQLFFAQNARYRIFFHQAILAATALALLPPEACAVLPAAYNYPLHLHADHPAAHAAACLDDLITCRYDEWSVLTHGAWASALHVSDTLRHWLVASIDVCSGNPPVS